MDISDHNGGLGENVDEVVSVIEAHDGNDGDALKQNVKHIVGQLGHP